MNNRLYFKDSKRLYEDKKRLFSKIEKERNHIGYYSLPKQNIDSILKFSDSFSDSIDTIVVLGIGGSSLGAKAIYEFLKPMEELKRKLIFFETTDPINISNTLKEIDISKTHFLVISKSGGTVETISIFKYLYALNQNSNLYTFITDRGSNMDKFAKEIESKIFYLPDNIGGRFSVLSVVGLIPLALCGIDIKTLLKGAYEISNSFFNDGKFKDILLDKAIFYAKNQNRYNINCIFAYSQTLQYFTEWYVQLWGESLGKKQRHSSFNVGLTPIGLIGPKDQHSFLQLIMEGTRDKSVTFIKLEKFEHKLNIPNLSLKYLESLDILNGVSFHQLLTMQSDSVIESLKNEQDIPLDEILLPCVDAKSIGSLIYYYELLTSLVGELLDVDTYNQPGVEAGKMILKKKLENL